MTMSFVSQARRREAAHSSEVTLFQVRVHTPCRIIARIGKDTLRSNGLHEAVRQGVVSCTGCPSARHGLGSPSEQAVVLASLNSALVNPCCRARARSSWSATPSDSFQCSGLHFHAHAVAADELEHVKVVALRFHERGILLLRQLGEALVQHRIRKGTHHFGAAKLGAVRFRARLGKHLDGNLRGGRFHLRFEPRNETAPFVHLAQVRIRRLAMDRLGIPEELLDDAFRERHVHVSRHHYRGALRRVPFLVEVPQTAGGSFS